MAKVSFTKIAPIHKVEAKNIDINGSLITIEQYLPISEKANFSERVINAAFDPNTSFASASRMEVYFSIELNKTYTNINLTDKLLEDPAKLYDLLVINNILNKVIESIPQDEYKELHDKVYEDQNHIETFMHSFVGMMQTVSNDYNKTSFDIENLMNTIKDPEALSTVKDILEKIG